MRVLLDNCVDIDAKSLFADHQVQHVLDRGWDALVNGRLLATAAEDGVQVLVTIDKNLRFQQNLEKLPLSVLEIDVVKSRHEEIRRLAPAIPKALDVRFASDL